MDFDDLDVKRENQWATEFHTMHHMQDSKEKERKVDEDNARQCITRSKT